MRLCARLSHLHLLSPLFFALFLLLAGTVPARAQTSTELRPVDFLVTGQFNEQGQGGLDRVWVHVVRQDTGETVIDRAFSQADGGFAATFSATLEVTVGLPDDPPVPETPGATVTAYQMGRIAPNPYSAGQGSGTRLLYLAPEGTPAPKLEIFDARGRRLKAGANASTGVYFYRLRFGDRATDARKLLSLSERLPQVRLIAASSEAQLRGEVPAAGAFSAKAPEGSLPVSVQIRKAGYQGVDLTLEFNSTTDNRLDVDLVAEAPPTASFSVVDGVAADEAVVFDAGASIAPDGNALQYRWDFGDGIHGGGAQVAHVYRAQGNYTARLTVASTWGAVDSTQTPVSVTAGTPPSTADAELLVLVADALGNLLEGVEVSVVDQANSALSDSTGAATLTGLPTGVPFSVRLALDGYTSQVVPAVFPAATRFTLVEATLRRRRTPVIVDRIEDGCIESGEDGVVIELPPDALLRGDGTPASGQAELSLTPVDVSDATEAGAFPGGYEGVRPDGSRGLILSYGVAEFVIEQGGESLQLAPGTSATIEIPIYTAGASSGDRIVLWSVDENTGLWTEEGDGSVVASAASPTGLALRAQVGHFSWWNSDAFAGDPYRPIPRCKIRDNNGLPTLDIPAGESCYIQGRVQGPGGPRSNPDSFVGPGGGPPLPVPADVDMLLVGAASNGTLRGSRVINGVAGFTEEIVIVLETLDATPGEMQLPIDQEIAMTGIGQVDLWSLDVLEGRSFTLVVGGASGSTLQGIARLKDPGGQLVDSASFGSNAKASFYVPSASAGSWILEVESTANAPGAYRLQGRYVESIALTPGTAEEIDLEPGFAQPFHFDLSAGSWFSLDLLRVAGSGTTAWELRAPDQSVMATGSAGSSGDWGLFQAVQPGRYEAVLSSTTLSGRLRIALRDVPELVAGGAHDLQADYKGFQYYRVSAVADRLLKAAADQSNGFRGNLIFKTAEGSNLPAVGYAAPQTSSHSSIIQVPAGDLFLRVASSYGNPQTTSLAYRLFLPYVVEGAPVVEDAYGRSSIGGSLDGVGAAKLHLFNGDLGDGLEIQLLPEGSTPLSPSAQFTVYPLSGGAIDSPGLELSALASRGNLPNLPLDRLEVRSYRLDQNSAYAVLVFDPEGGSGAYRLQTDRVAGSASIVVDDDLADRPDADTRSVTAAFYALQEGGSLELAAGEHMIYDFLRPQVSGLQIFGAGRDLSTLRLAGAGSVMLASSELVSLRDLTVQASTTSFGSLISISNSVGTVLEDLRIRNSSPSGTVYIAFEVNNGSGLTVRRVEFSGCFKALKLFNNDGATVEDCVFTGNAGLISNRGGHENIIQRNQWTSTALGTVIQLDEGSGHQVLDNQIDITTSDLGATADDPAIRVEDRDTDGSRPMSVVRGNRIATNEAGFYLRAGYAGSKIVCERNRVEMRSLLGDRAIHILPVRSDGTGVVVARNNLLIGVDSYRGVYCQQAEYLQDVQIVNNTLQMASGTNPQAGNALIEIARQSSSFTGALPVTIVNNVVVGIGVTTAVKISIDCTVDSDYNLFDQFGTFYADGGTSTGGNDLTGADPLLIGADLMLDDGSPAIDSGATTAQYGQVPSQDYAGNPRPAGGGVDRGAHER